MLATTGDFLRIWKITDDGVKLKSLLNNNKNSEFCAPLTSFDWNELARASSATHAPPPAALEHLHFMVGWHPTRRPARALTRMRLEQDPKRFGTSSIDTTCTIWDIEREVVDTQARRLTGEYSPALRLRPCTPGDCELPLSPFPPSLRRLHLRPFHS